MAKFKVEVITTSVVEHTITADNCRQALEIFEQKKTMMETLEVLKNISKKIYIAEVSKSGGVAQD